jgi:hypothetical protein
MSKGLCCVWGARRAGAATMGLMAAGFGLPAVAAYRWGVGEIGEVCVQLQQQSPYCLS